VCCSRLLLVLGRTQGGVTNIRACTGVAHGWPNSDRPLFGINRYPSLLGFFAYYAA
jgi:hypothetical protein